MTVSIAVQSARADAYQSIAFGSLSGTYTAFANPINHNYRILDFENTTNADVSISFDGTTNNLYLPAGSYRLYDLGINGMVTSKNTVVYAKTAGTPTSGAVYVTGWYQQGT